MPRSILISLTAESSYPILGTLGRPVQAWFLGQLTRSNTALASRLHDEQGLKPYTVSTLLDSRSHPLRTGSWMEPGENCLIRLTTLTDELSHVLDTKVLRRLPNRITIHKMDFRVDDVLTRRTEHEWADETSFSDIAQDVALASSGGRVRMEFVSPTAFRSNGLDICLPIPFQIFRSLWEKWNTFAPEPMQIHEMWPNFVNDCVFIDELTAINTTHWDFTDGMKESATGFTGTARFYLPPKPKIKKDWHGYIEGADAVMQSLAAFAFYSGVGHHTTRGMGQTRLVPEPKIQTGPAKNPIPRRFRK